MNSQSLHDAVRGGDLETIYENLQALCEKCNCTKRDKDESDFRRFGEDVKPVGIPFFNRKWILENERAFAVLDGFPVTKGHTLICPKRSFADLFEASRAEMGAIWELTNQRKRQLTQEDRLVTGFNFGVNSGTSAGQTVPHCHFHLIPRRDGDMPNPKGGGLYSAARVRSGLASGAFELCEGVFCVPAA